MGGNQTMNEKIYRSPYEAYPFLADPSEDFRCDFEILTDRISSETGLLRSIIRDEILRYDCYSGRSPVAERLCRPA